MEVIVQKTREEMSRAAAREVANVLNAKPNAVLGMATGSTPLGLYQELVRLHQRGELDFSHVTTFNLDEYVGLPITHPQSYHQFMHENFFRHINIPAQNIHIPSGTTTNYPAFCAWYEQRIRDAGGIDLQILGIGSDGHIAFNEPGSSLSSRTRLKTLAKQTIDDNARFFEHRNDVPIYAITMGVGTILEAREILLLANGANKADAIASAVEGPVTSMITASALQMHPSTRVYVDEPAASKLKMREYYDWIQEKKPGAGARADLSGIDLPPRVIDALLLCSGEALSYSDRFSGMTTPEQTQFVAGWGTLSLVNAGLAQGKSRSGLLWWVFSLLLGPVATFLIVVLPPVDRGPPTLPR